MVVETLDNKTIIQSHLCLPSLRRLTPLGGWGILRRTLDAYKTSKEKISLMVKGPDSRQRFRARITVFNEQRRRQLSSAVGGATIPEELHMVLEDYLHISLKRREAPLSLFKLQMHMIQDLAVAEQAIAQYKQEREERLKQIDNCQDEKVMLEGEIKVIERELRFNEAEVRALRDIADGIAWRMFDFDRATLTELANRPGRKHLNIEGINAELHEFAAVFHEREGVAVFNELTHFLKLGDVTIRKNSGEFEIVEVKTGHKTSGRITRQKQDMRRSVTFLNTGEREEEAGRIGILELDIRPETFHRLIDRIFRDAGEKGAVVERIGDHLIVECIDFMRVGKVDRSGVESVMARAREWTERWEAEGDLVLSHWSQEKYLEVRNYAPFSIFPFPEIVRVKLMTGSLWLVTYVNISAVTRYFEQRGWKVVKTYEQLFEEAEETGDARMMGLVTVRKGPSTIEVPAPLFGRLGHEFVKPRTLVDTLESVLSRGERVNPIFS